MFTSGPRLLASSAPHFIAMLPFHAAHSIFTVALLHSRTNTPLPAAVSAQSPSGSPSVQGSAAAFLDSFVDL